MPEKVILDPSHRRLSNIFTDADLARVCAAADIVWAKDEPMPEVEVAKVRDDVVAIIRVVGATATWPAFPICAPCWR